MKPPRHFVPPLLEERRGAFEISLCALCG